MQMQYTDMTFKNNAFYTLLIWFTPYITNPKEIRHVKTSFIACTVPLETF